jgi:hypothetical protein
MIALGESIGKLDSTLVDAARIRGMRLANNLNRLQERRWRAEQLRNEVIARHADALSNALFPHKALQEREVGGREFCGALRAGAAGESL